MRVTEADYRELRARVEISRGASELERWNALWSAVDNGRLDYGFLRPYHDSHIDTALRRISREEELEE